MIAPGFVLAWTSIGGVYLRANLAGMEHLHPDIFHLVNGSVECLAIIKLVIIAIYEMAFLQVYLFDCSRVCSAVIQMAIVTSLIIARHSTEPFAR